MMKENRKQHRWWLAGLVSVGCLIPLLASGQSLSGGPDATEQEEAESGAGQERLEPPDGYVLIPPGRFQQGSPETEEGRQSIEGPQREVTISRPFWLKRTVVTQEEWEDLMGNNPSSFSSLCGLDCPVEQVSWYDAVEYVNRLSEREGLESCYEGSGDSIRFKGLDCEGYRLPTEAEWEYAARAGTRGPRYRNLVQIAWYRGNTAGHTRPVGQMRRNRFGLYDIIGNVWEWTNDWFGEYESEDLTDPEGPSTGTGRVLRGCSWLRSPEDCRAAYRYILSPSYSDDRIGFRPARSVPPEWWAAREARREARREALRAESDSYVVFRIDGKFFSFIEYHDRPLLITEGCGSRCDALRAVRAVRGMQSGAARAGQPSFEGTDLCEEHSSGQKVEGIGRRGIEVLFCRFGDGSMVSLASLEAFAAKSSDDEE